MIIGIVSRGNGCADKNEPGKATRVKRFLSWIAKVTGGGSGKNDTSDDAAAASAAAAAAAAAQLLRPV